MLRRTGSVLIIDDDEFQRSVLALQLAELGYPNVLYAESGIQALAVLDKEERNISLIISDLHMPNMDGFVLMRHLADRYVEIALILTSGVGKEILNSAGVLANAHGLNLLGVLSKPHSLQSLRDLLGELSVSQRRSTYIHKTLSSDRLKAAIAAEDFLPWYQPKVSLRENKVIGVEALARWPLNGDEMVGPNVFIPMIEKLGLADELFFSMARQVANDTECWRKQGIHLISAINLSMETAYCLELPERLMQIVLDNDLQPTDFVIEITESRLMANRSSGMETLTRLSMMGFALSIDDFGTGYSSLVQLVDLPFNELKIDGSFVRRFDKDKKSAEVVRIATMLGRNLGMKVVAEGVETKEQLDFVRECSVDIIQGYYYSRPMPFKDCTSWLLSR